MRCGNAPSPKYVQPDYMTKVYAHFGYRPYWERASSFI